MSKTYTVNWNNPIGTQFSILGTLFSGSGIYTVSQEVVDFFYFQLLMQLGFMVNLTEIVEEASVKEVAVEEPTDEELEELTK